MARVWTARAGALVRSEAVLVSNLQQATQFVGEIAFESTLRPYSGQTSSIVAEFGIDGDSIWWPGYPVAFDPPFRIVGEFGLSLSKGSSSIFPFEFDRGIDDKTALVQALNDAGYEGGGGGGTPFDDSFDIVLSDGDEDVSQGALDLTGLSVGESIVNLDVLLGKLIPPQPPAFPNGTLSISNAAGNDPRLATGFTDNIASGLTAGTSVTRITAAGVSTFAFNDVGPGNAGVLQALLNGAVAADRTLTGADEGSYSGLVIADQKDYPTDRPGFWKSMDVSLNLLAVPVGVDKIRLNHTAAGQTNEAVFIRDTLTAVPTVSAGSVVQENAGVLAYSSSVPHYGTGASLTVGMSFNNLAGETYYGGSDPVTISGSNSIIAAKSLSYGAIGITTPIARNTTAAQAITPQSIAIDGTNVHTSG
uniref:Tail fiber protein n=1 Tax=Caulobacter phage BL57 TaxID=3348355 RepID=A0AB74UIK2_9VIRU